MYAPCCVAANGKPLIRGTVKSFSSLLSLKSTLTTEDIARIFSLTADNVRQVRHRASRKKKEPHRPLAINPEQEAFVAFIHERFGLQNYAT
jgi:hypothetical protein